MGQRVREKGKPRRVPGVLHSGGAHRGKGDDISSAMTVERLCDDGGMLLRAGGKWVGIV